MTEDFRGEHVGPDDPRQHFSHDHRPHVSSAANRY
jgi:hypothetical protein